MCSGINNISAKTLSDCAPNELSDKPCDLNKAVLQNHTPQCITSVRSTYSDLAVEEYFSETCMEESGSGVKNISLDESIVNNNTYLDDLKHIRIKNIHRVVIGQININSLRNKFDFLSSLISGNIDILLITETKLDNSFPEAQFHIEGFASPYRLDRNANGGGILLYVREDISSKLLRNTSFRNNNIEAMFVEINLRKKKWLLSCSYNPHKSEIMDHLNEI